MAVGCFVISTVIFAPLGFTRAQTWAARASQMGMPTSWTAADAERRDSRSSGHGAHQTVRYSRRAAATSSITAFPRFFAASTSSLASISMRTST